MAEYRFRARDKQGNLKEGIMHAVDEDDLYRRLKKEEQYLVSAQADGEDRKLRQLSAKMLSEFNRELGDMLGAGVTLVRALTILSQEETRKPKERDILGKVLKMVRQGVAISDAMERQNGAFPVLMINMYRAAETGGNLAGTAKRLAVHYEKEHQLHTKIQGATLYPRILAVLVVLVVAFIMSFILPQLSDLFDSLETLPTPTRILFAMSGFIGRHWIGLLILGVILGVVGTVMGQMPVIRHFRDRIKLRLPLVGKMLTVIYTARFARSLSSLYSAGIPIITAIQISKRTIGNSYIEGQFDEVLKKLRAGRPLSEALDGVDGFRNKLSSVIRIGEESGDLVQMLDAMADSFDYESEMAVGRLINYLEPVLIIFMAFIVGFIMISVMMPIYDSYSAIGSSSYY